MASPKLAPPPTNFWPSTHELFTEEVWFLADMLNADLDEVTVSVEAVVTQQDHQECFEFTRYTGWGSAGLNPPSTATGPLVDEIERC